MPHATEDEFNMGVDEKAEMERFLAGGGDPVGGMGDGSALEIDTTGKVDDAIDYEDFDDDDLPEEEEATNGGQNGQADGEAHMNGFHDEQMDGLPTQLPVEDFQEDDAKPPGDFFGDGEEVNDLFGEPLTSSPVEERHPVQVLQPPPQRPSGLALPSKSSLALPRPVSQATGTQVQTSPRHLSPPSPAQDAYSPAPSMTEDEDSDEEVRMQRKLFKVAELRRQGQDVEYDIVGMEDKDAFFQRYPTYEEDEVPRFTELFPPVPGVYRGKLPPKPPKPIQPTKLSLDLLPDQEKSFRTVATMAKLGQDASQGGLLINSAQPSASKDESNDEFALSELDEDEEIGGITMQDLTVICEDWDLPSIDTASFTAGPADEERLDGDWDAEEQARPAKKQRLDHLSTDASLSLRNSFLPFEDPERAASRVAKNVVLDMNDPYLLLDEHTPQSKRKARHIPGDNRRNVALGRDLARRYNISNDEAYDLLKENHNHKVRSTLGSMAIEHSLPATKLQWPFYKVALDPKEKRAFHRVPLHLNEAHGRAYRFSKPRFQKKKHVRGREAKDLFAKAEDLSFGDNSNLLMLEYSEEAPVMLSNFGMGNRLINYYRKRDADDQERPKREIGETHVLLNQDKSPFSNFGHVDSGETVPTIQNALYRAPVFQHQPKSNDFILAISHTHENGNKLYIRNVENLHTVGQQFPLAEVPGEHSRKVTDASKKRLRAISFRIYGKAADPTRRGIALTNKVIMRHIPGSDVPQTRSKMREFMKYEKKAKNSEDDGYWVPPPGQAVPDAETMRSWIKPEDVCMLDAMQVGVQHLQDLGISTSKDAENEDEDEVEDGANIEKLLAPWALTKNFLNACQGKAMLTLHGKGDPTGAGAGFSFIRTSMKGGYVPEGQSVEERINGIKKKESGGHKYNVATQQAMYDASIRKIWETQKQSLGNADEAEINGEEDRDEAPESAYPYGAGGTPRTSFGTPAAFDDSASQFSRQSMDRSDEILVIKRKHRDQFGNWVETPQRIDNPKVIKLYRRRKQEQRLAKLSHLQMQPTGDAELDALAQQKLKQELARLERNKDRRVAREKLKGRMAAQASGANAASASSPGAAGSPGPSELGGEGQASGADTTPAKGSGKGRTKDGTARKCANCGMVGHIKTNRKLCPMLNGQWKPEENPGSNGENNFGAVPQSFNL